MHRKQRCDHCQACSQLDILSSTKMCAWLPIRSSQQAFIRAASPDPITSPMGPLSLRGGGKFESTTIALSWAPRLRPLKKLWLHLATIGHGWGLRFRGCHLEQWQVPDEAEDQVQPHLQRLGWGILWKWLATTRGKTKEIGVHPVRLRSLSARRGFVCLVCTYSQRFEERIMQVSEHEVFPCISQFLAAAI